MAEMNPLLEVKRLGQSIWLDSIRRGQILSGELGRAQALGDWQALRHHGRRAVGVRLKPGASLAELAEAVRRSVRQQGPGTEDPAGPGARRGS